MVAVREWTGRETGLLRAALRLSSRDFAARLGVDVRAVTRWQARGAAVTLRPHMQAVLDTALRQASDEAKSRFAALLTHAASRTVPPQTLPSDAGTPLAPDPLVRQLRRTLLTRQVDDPALVVMDGDAAAIGRVARRAHDAYQRCDYRAAAALLPGTIVAAEQLVRQLSGQAQRQAHRVLALAHVAASKLSVKLGDATLAWMAADRAASSAIAAEDQALSAMAAYQSGCALMHLPDRLHDATDVITAALTDLAPAGKRATPVELSVRGALLLLAALVAARTADSAATADLLTQATRLADRLGGDRNDLWSGFGPTNVLIHQLSATVELHQPDQAIPLGERLDTSRLPPVLVSRRAQVHLDLAAALTSKHQPAPAVLHLLEAERLAPQLIHAGHPARAIIQQLLHHQRHASTPGLRPLADRADVQR